MKIILVLCFFSFGVIDASELYRNGIINSPLVDITEPLFMLTKYYCSKAINPHDWFDASFLMNRLIAYDNITINSSDLQDTSKTLWKCAKLYQGDNDLAGYVIILEDEPTPTTEAPNAVSTFLTKAYNKTVESSFVKSVSEVMTKTYEWTLEFKFAKMLSAHAQKIFKGAKKTVKVAKKMVQFVKDKLKQSVQLMWRAAQVFFSWLIEQLPFATYEREAGDEDDYKAAQKILQLLPRIAKKACNSELLFPIKYKYLSKLEDLMRMTLMIEWDVPHDGDPFSPLSAGLDKCLSYSHAYFWETKEELNWTEEESEED